MAKSRRYAPEYRQQMVELVRTGRTAQELSREFECSPQAIRNWVRQAELDEGRRSGDLTTVERDELRRLRRENLQLRCRLIVSARVAVCSQRHRVAGLASVARLAAAVCSPAS